MIGPRMSKPHTDNLNANFVCLYIYIYIIYHSDFTTIGKLSLSRSYICCIDPSKQGNCTAGLMSLNRSTLDLHQSEIKMVSMHDCIKYP